MSIKCVYNWSGGKDSAIALYYMQKENKFDIQYLLTSVNQEYQRVSMHGVRVDLLHKQAEAIGIPLKILEVPEMPTMEIYNKAMRKMLLEMKDEGIQHSVFGDIFLEDLKDFRDQQLAKVDFKGVYPIWKRPTDRLVREFIDLGFKAKIVCVNNRCLDESFVGRNIDEQFLNDLPDSVDPCGENGEFHSFVYDGPIYSNPIDVVLGEKVFKDYKPCAKEKKEMENSYNNHDTVVDNGFWYCDLLFSDTIKS